MGVVMNFQSEVECQSSMMKIDLLLNCGIFDSANSDNILQSAAFTELVICLRDLLCKAAKFARRVSFTDDILTNDYVRDVTDAVTAVRDACCHIDSYKRIFDDHENRGAFLVIYGKRTALNFGDFEVNSEYEDDTAIYYGKNRLYFNRHIVRAFSEAKSLLEPLLRDMNARSGI